MTLQLAIPGRPSPTIIRPSGVTERLEQLTRGFIPRTQLGVAVARALPLLPADAALELLERLRDTVVLESSLSLRVMRGLGLIQAGLLDPRELRIEDHGEVGRRVVTDLGVAYLVDSLQNIVEPESLKFHAIGTGTTAEAATGAGAAMVTELTTEYNPNSTRATGSTTEGATSNIYKSVGTNTLDGTPGAALREHGLFDNATVGSGTCFDRTLFAAITLSSGDALESTYQLTLTSGG